jgi:hypothetical protein
MAPAHRLLHAIHEVEESGAVMNPAIALKVRSFSNPKRPLIRSAKVTQHCGSYWQKE